MVIYKPLIWMAFDFAFSALLMVSAIYKNVSPWAWQSYGPSSNASKYVLVMYMTKKWGN